MKPTNIEVPSLILTVKANTPPQLDARSFSFRWSYIILPLAILLLSILLTIFFYGRLPAEVAYRFQADGSPDGWLSRQTITLSLLVPQFILFLVSGGITWGISKLFQHRTPDSRINSGRIIALMGNMLALPQIILFFAMLSIFGYNSYRIYLMPLWVFGLIIALLGTVILGIFFRSAIRLTR